MVVGALPSSSIAGVFARDKKEKRPPREAAAAVRDLD